MARLYTLILVISLLPSCGLFQPEAHVSILIARDTEPVNIEVLIGGKRIFNDTVRYTNIADYFPYRSSIALPKGKYLIKVVVDGEKAYAMDSIDLMEDRWIFVSYGVLEPIDSAEANRLINEGMDTSYVYPRLKGPLSSASIYVFDNKE